MTPEPEASPLRVRRSILIQAAPERVWREFETRERMTCWWGVVIGSPEAGTSQGQPTTSRAKAAKSA